MIKKDYKFEPLQYSSDRMFLGSIDDSVTRYPWRDVKVNLEALNTSLIFYALLGPKLCCRIGNILYNPEYFKAFLEPSSSILLPLAKTGFFQFQMKEATINEAISARQEIRTNSTLEFIKKYEWSKKSQIFHDLNELDAQLPLGLGKIQYSAKFHKHFQKIIDEMSPNPQTDFGNIFYKWNKRFLGRERTRSNFEELAKLEFTNNPSAIQHAMSPINSINHYAYGLGLKENFGDVSIETVELPELQKYTRTYFGQEERSVHVDRLIDLNGLGIFNVIEDNLKIPDLLIKDPKCWDKLAFLASAESTTSSQHEFNHLKAKMITTINEISFSDNLPESKKELALVSQELGKFVSSELGLLEAPTVPVKFRMYLGKVAGKSSDLTLGDAVATAADAVVPGASFAVRLIAQFGVDKISALVNRNVDEFRTTVDDDNVKFLKNISQAINCPSIRLINEIPDDDSK